MKGKNMDTYKVLVQLGSDIREVEYPSMYDENHCCVFGSREDFFEAVGEAVEDVILDWKRERMVKIPLSKFQSLLSYPVNVGDISFLSEKKAQLVCGVGDVVFLRERYPDGNVVVGSYLIVED